MIQKIRQVFQGEKPSNEQLKQSKPKDQPTEKEEQKDPGKGKVTRWRPISTSWKRKGVSKVPRHVLRRRKWRSRNRKFKHIG